MSWVPKQGRSNYSVSSDDLRTKGNLMKIKALFAVFLLCFSLTAAAQGRIVSQAYEVGLDDFRAPATVNGGVVFKACSKCEHQRVRVTANTRYAINGKTVRFEDFRKAVQQVENRDEKMVTVVHHLESDTIKSLDAAL